MALITDKGLTQEPRTNDIWLTDEAPRGAGRFCARITPDGRRLFYFKYTSSTGKRKYIPLGVYDPTGKKGLRLTDARTKAGEYSRLYQSGVIDIKEHQDTERRRVEAEQAAEEARLEVERKTAEVEAARLTVRELFDKWEKSARIVARKDKGAENRRLFEKDVFPAIGTLPAHLIRKAHVMEIADGITERGATRTARIVFSALRQMFRYALARDFVETDPTAAIGKAEQFGKDNERERTLTDDEIKLLAKQISTANLTQTTEAAVWIALSTGCRIGELLKARWEHVDLKKRRWLIPAENSKNTIPLEVYLSGFALPYFETLKRHQHTDWLYPARWKDKETGKPRDSHVSVKTVTKQIGDRQKAKPKTRGVKAERKGTLALPGGLWTPHDLRRTASTIMGDIGIRPEVIDRCQNHKEPNRVRRTYQRYSYRAEMEEAWKLLGARLEALTSQQEIAKVVPLKRGA